MNLAMLLYLACNEEVLLVQSGDMYRLLQKAYSFTPKFHAEKDSTVVVDGAFIITYRNEE